MIVIDASAYVEFLTCPPAAPIRQRLAKSALIHLPAVVVAFDTGAPSQAVNAARKACGSGVPLAAQAT